MQSVSIDIGVKDYGSGPEIEAMAKVHSALRIWMKTRNKGFLIGRETNSR